MLAHRELSFEYEKGGVQRYVVFADAQAMKNRMISTRDETPLKVDAGAIWNRVPEKESNGKTIEREFIFDFDMNDYDDVRTCCKGKKVCEKCWRLLVIAVEVIERALAEDFDLHKLMFVFSGGRGLHIWVCD
jgi:DNA primase small subunit